MSNVDNTNLSQNSTSNDERSEEISSMEYINDLNLSPRRSVRDSSFFSFKTILIALTSVTVILALVWVVLMVMYSLKHIDIQSYKLQPDQTVIITVTPENEDVNCSTQRVDTKGALYFSTSVDQFSQLIQSDQTGAFNVIDSPDVVKNLKCTRQYVFMGSVSGSAHGEAVKLSFPAVLRVTTDSDRTVEIANSKLNELLQADGSLIDHLYNVENGVLK